MQWDEGNTCSIGIRVLPVTIGFSNSSARTRSVIFIPSAWLDELTFFFGLLSLAGSCNICSILKDSLICLIFYNIEMIYGNVDGVGSRKYKELRNPDHIVSATMKKKKREKLLSGFINARLGN